MNSEWCRWCQTRITRAVTSGEWVHFLTGQADCTSHKAEPVSHTTAISVRLPQVDLEALDRLVAAQQYTSRSEGLRHGLELVLGRGDGRDQ